MGRSSIGQYINDAQRRAQRRKSPWNLLLIPLTIAGAAFCWWLFAYPIFFFQNSMISQDTFLSSGTKVGLIMFYVGLGLAAVGPGMIVANIMAWFIPSVRLTFNREAQGYSGSDLRSSIRGLMKFSIVVFGVVYPISFFGGLNYYSLSTKGIFYRRMGTFEINHYSWNQVQEIKTQCWTKKADGEGEFVLVLNDTTKIDLFSSSPRKFFPAYPNLSLALNGIPFQFHYYDFQFNAYARTVSHVSSTCPDKWIPYFMKRPGT